MTTKDITKCLKIINSYQPDRFVYFRVFADGSGSVMQSHRNGSPLEPNVYEKSLCAFNSLGELKRKLFSLISKLEQNVQQS